MLDCEQLEEANSHGAGNVRDDRLITEEKEWNLQGKYNYADYQAGYMDGNSERMLCDEVALFRTRIE